MVATHDERADLPESLLLAQLNRGFSSLRFMPALESRFRDYLRSYLVNHLRLGCTAGIALIATAQLLSALALSPPAFAMRWQTVLFCGAMLPLLLHAYYVLAQPDAARRIDTVAASLIWMLVAIGLLMPVIYARQDAVFPYRVLELVVVLIPTLAARRLPVALAWVCGVLALLLVRDAVAGGWSASTWVDVFNAACFGAMGLAAGFVQEWILRRNFLVEGLYMLRAVRDPLTQLYNRRGFEDEGARIWAMARRSGLMLGVAVVDIDHFKAINDSRGHAAGDKVLGQVANVLRHQAARRPMDLIGRIGGEEFAVLWFDLAATNVTEQAERLRQAVEQRHLAHPADRGLTVSVGCTQLVPQAGDNLADALAAADDALYRAKADGRNCVRRAEAAPEPSATTAS